MLLLILVLWCNISWIHINSIEAEKCLHEFPDLILKKKFTSHGQAVPVTISHGEHASHFATAHLIKILVEDGLGYSNAKLVFCDVTGETGSCWNDRFPDIPPRAMIDPEVWVPFDHRDSETSGKMTDIGSLGIMGRAGWFISADFVDRLWTDHRTSADHWRALQLPFVLKQLSSLSDLIISQGCVEYEFHPSQCSQTNQTGGQCVVLLAGHRDNASQLAVDQITRLQLNISIVWLGERLPFTIIENKAKGKPLLFYIWDPDPLTITGDFRRISFPDCNFPKDNISLTNPRWIISTGCDFPMYDLHKYIWKEIQKRYNDIYRLVKAITFTREQLTELMQPINTTGYNASIEEHVCRWLNKSRDVWFPWIQAQTATKRTVYIGGMFPSLVEPKAIWSSPGDEIGARMAVQEVNNDTSILNSLTLKLLVSPTQCRRELVIAAYIRYLNRDPSENVIGILGPACSRATLPIAEASSFRKTMLMGYGADDVSLSDRTRFPLFFRTNPSVDEFKAAYLSLFRAFGWKHCAILREAKYPVNTVRSRTEFLNKHGIEVLSRELASSGDLDVSGYISTVVESKVTVIILDAYPAVTRAVTCQAYKQGLTAENGYVWFLLDWLEIGWWDVDFYNSRSYTSPENVPCTSDQLKSFIDQGYFTLSSPFFGDDKQKIVGGGTVKEWKERYMFRVASENKEWSDYASFAHDSVWTYALALDQLLKIDSTALDTVHSNTTSEIFRERIQEVNFLGVSGRVHFKNGDRLANILVKQQFVSRYEVIGQFVHAKDINGSLPGHLQWDLSRIKWTTGQIPGDLLPEPGGKEICSVETLRKALNVSCRVAITVVVVVAVSLVSVVLLIVGCILKGRYSSKYRDTKKRLRELGLLDSNSTGAIFALDDWEMPREKLILNRKLGEGAFGAVFGGEGLGLMGSNVSVPVAVKTLRVGATIEDKVEFLSEADNMKLLSHPNVVKLLGVCTTGEPVYIVMELMIHGDLKNFLLARRRSVDQPETPEADDVTPRRLTSMALDIARGLQYLGDMKFVHRDLALRNCMVGFGNVVKIGDFGLARPLQGTDYYRFQRNGILPVRWMSPESIKEGIFTLHTDVWSYGVTLWELSTIGGFPYQGLSNAEVLEKVELGCTLEIPHHSSREMASLLRKCWSQDPSKRPKPYEIVRILINNPEFVRASIEVPATTLLDNSVGSFDARKASTRARTGLRSPQSMNSFRRSDQVSSTMNLTLAEQGNDTIEESTVKPDTGRTKRDSSMLWR